MLRIAWVVMCGAALFARTECAPCHPREVRRHLQTNHARALRPAGETEFARALPVAPVGEARGGFLLSYARDGQALEVTAERGRERARGRIEWAFGAGDQGVTPVVRAGGRWLEHRISYYTKPGRFDLTLGHQPGVSRSADAAIGVAQATATIRACFGCHSTVDQDLRVLRPGVDCERCHAGADRHARGQGPAPYVNKLDSRGQVEMCGGCHRLAPPSGDETDPLNIRFQPLRLIQSRCYLAGGLRCADCHPAHENARRSDPGFYRAKCLACHASQAGKGDCLECHMRKAAAAPYLAFTDHWIRK
ncbi:MAG: cytochrome c3 family protein [Candidatus Solibacter usitatus]|nr:cytochrome c3 family protein [Candidatus Solibacter usitatus]